MQTVAYTALHYGAQYLRWAIRSVIDQIDTYVVLYSPEGSHGTRSAVRCPESRDQLYAIAQDAAGLKLKWIDGVWDYEGQQRDTIYDIAPYADLILTVDADEIWATDMVYHLQKMRFQAPRKVRLPMIHYWRSFHKAIVHDPAFPVRAVFPKMKDTEETIWEANFISHM